MFSTPTTLVSVGLENMVSKKRVFLEHSKGHIELQAIAATVAFGIPCDQEPPGKKSHHHISRGN